MKSEFSNRTRFNWGYHDAAMEARAGHRRILVKTGPHDLQHVSRAYCQAYFYGYSSGLADFDTGLYYKDSTEAWEFVVAIDLVEA